MDKFRKLSDNELSQVVGSLGFNVNFNIDIKWDAIRDGSRGFIDGILGKKRRY